MSYAHRRWRTAPYFFALAGLLAVMLTGCLKKSDGPPQVKLDYEK